MRDKLVIVPCGKKKIWDDGVTKGPVMARFAYNGAMFQFGRWYADVMDADWVVLSAKYGYLDQYKEIEPYDVTFSRKSSNPIHYKELSSQLFELNLTQYKEVITLGGKEYRDAVINSFSCVGRTDIHAPFAGLSQGNYLHKIKEAIKKEIIDKVNLEYAVVDNEACVVDKTGNISFSSWPNYWSIPQGGSCGYEGPSYATDSNIDMEFSTFQVNQKKELLRKFGPKQGAWEQLRTASTLIGKKLIIQMWGDMCEDPYPMEALCTGVHLSNDREGFVQCYMCLKDISNQDTHLGPENGMYDGSCHLLQAAEGVSLLSLAKVNTLSVIEDKEAK